MIVITLIMNIFKIIAGLNMLKLQDSLQIQLSLNLIQNHKEHKDQDQIGILMKIQPTT